MVSLPLESIRTHCPYCAYQCGVLMGDPYDAEENRVQGDPHFPVNNGQLCIKGWTAGGLLRHPARLTTPLVRSAGGKLEPTDWDDALDRIAAMLRDLRTAHGADSVAVFGSGSLTNEKAYLLGKFARLALGTSHIDYNGRYCMASAAAANNRAFGIDRGLPFPVSDIARADVVLLVGSNVADTLPPIVQWFQKQKQAGGRLIVADPRRTPTARSADLFLQLMPGTDLILANGLLHLAIEEGLIDTTFIAGRTTGFEAVRRAVLTYTPEVVERATGIGEPMLRRTIRWLAQAPAAMILSGRGAEQHSKGVDTVLAFINLALALGKVGKPASGYGCLTGQGNGQGGREHGQKADQLPGYRLIEVPEHREAVARIWGVDPTTLPGKGKSAFELLDSLGPEGGIRGLFVMGSNVAVASPDAGRIQRRLQGLDFLVVCDAFLNETCETADVVLPILQWAEEDGTMTNLEGRVVRRRVVVHPPAGPRSDLEILCELAARLGHAERFTYASTEAVFDELRRATAGAIADYSGITYRRIDAEDGVFWPCPGADHPGTPRLFAERFHHADGRARFHAVEHRPAGEEPDAEYPLRFTTGRYREHYNSGAQTRRLERLRKVSDLPRLQIHPRLARRYAISAGSRVVLESRRGRAEFVAELDVSIRPDTVFVPFHWGGKMAANLLTNPVLDPISRMPEFKLAAVRVARVLSIREVNS